MRKIIQMNQIKTKPYRITELEIVTRALVVAFKNI